MIQLKIIQKRPFCTWQRGTPTDIYSLLSKDVPEGWAVAVTITAQPSGTTLLLR